MQVMLIHETKTDSQGNELQFGTNCLGPFLLYQQLQPLLKAAASDSHPVATRVLWAGSIGIEVMAPSPGGLLWDKENDQPKLLDPQVNYAQTKVGNLFLTEELAKKDAEFGIVHVCFNPGNLRTDLQRHWTGIGAWMTVRASSLSKYYNLQKGNRLIHSVTLGQNPSVPTYQWGLHRTMGCFGSQCGRTRISCRLCCSLGKNFSLPG